MEEEEELEERDPLFKKKLLVVVLAPILAVGVDVDAANESAVSGVLKVTPAIELFLLSACSNSGNLGTESFAPATTVEKLHMKKETKFKKPIHEYQLLIVKQLDLNLRG